MLIIWLTFLLWVIVCCVLLGYQASPGIESSEGQGVQGNIPHIPLRAGLPSWILWGIAIPWLSATLITLLFGIKFLREDDLGIDLGSEVEPQSGESRAVS